MPRYSKSRGKKLVKKKTKGFNHPYEVIHYLTTAREEGLKPMRDKAKEYLQGESLPPIPLSKDALAHVAYNDQRYLAHQSVHDFNEQLGGGIGSAVSVIGSQISHLVGFDQFMDFIGSVPKPKDQSIESEYMAFLVDQTYKDRNERPAQTLMFTRLPDFDTEHISVWQNNITSELTVTVRGTKLNPSDMMSDVNVLFGSKHIDDVEFTTLLDKVHNYYPGQKYDVAAHSLGCVYLMQEAEKYGSNWDDTYLFNAPSSPAQNDHMLQNQINEHGLDFYINHADPLGSNTNYFMNPETLQNHVQVGDYVYSPFGAHSLTQWYQQDIADTYTPPERPDSWLKPFEWTEDAPETQEAPEAPAQP